MAVLNVVHWNVHEYAMHGAKHFKFETLSWWWCHWTFLVFWSTKVIIFVRHQGSMTCMYESDFVCFFRFDFCLLSIWSPYRGLLHVTASSHPLASPSDTASASPQASINQSSLPFLPRLPFCHWRLAGAPLPPRFPPALRNELAPPPTNLGARTVGVAPSPLARFLPCAVGWRCPPPPLAPTFLVQRPPSLFDSPILPCAVG